MAKDKNLQKEAPQPKVTASAESILNRESDDAESLVPVKKHRVDIDWKAVEMCMTIGGDLKMCAMYGGCHWNTLERRIQERYGEGFREVRAAFLTDRKAMALKQMWNLVAKGNPRMVQFANRAFNGVNDRPKEMDDDNDDGSTFTLNYNLDTPPPAIEADFEPIED